MKIRHITILLGSFSIVGCASVEPQIEINSTGSFPKLPTLKSVKCEEGTEVTALSDELQKQPYVKDAGELGGIAGIIASAFIGKGVDLLGSKLKAAGEEQKLSFEAQTNKTTQPKSGARIMKCYDLARDGISIRFAMLPTADLKYVNYQVASLTYPKTLDEKTSGVRGLALTVEIRKPGLEKAVSQTITLHNVEIGSTPVFNWNDKLLTSAFIANPYVRPETDAELKKRKDLDKSAERKLLPDLPFTITARLSEVRDANELYQFGAGVVEEANDDLTAALIKAFGIGTGSSADSDEGGDDSNVEGERETGDPTSSES